MDRNPLSRQMLFLALLMSFSLLFSGQAKAQATSADDMEELRVDLPPLCSFGVNVNIDNGPEIQDFDTRPLRLGWYIDYHADANPVSPNGASYAPMIRLNQQAGTKNFGYTPNGSTLTAAIEASPGAIWLIGNEPDRIEYQDDIEPDVYATAYHDLYHLIKAVDPTARIYAGNIVQATTIRLQYLDLVLASYRSQYGDSMPVDGWSIHGFILNEQRGGWGAEIPPGVDADEGLVLIDENGDADVERTDDLDLYTSHVINFRNWMKTNGYQQKPLVMSEYGVLMPVESFPQFDAGRVNAFMDSTFDFLLNQTDPNTGYSKDNFKLVQQLSWYSTSDKERFNGNLYELTSGNPLSLMGQNYAQYVATLSEQTDFFPVSMVANPPVPLPNVGNSKITLQAEIANAGNNQNVKTVDVNFYLGDPEAGGQLIGTKTTSLRGCGETTTVSLVWSNPPIGESATGAYDLFAKVVAGDTGLDAGTNDSTISFKLYENPELSFLPSLSR